MSIPERILLLGLLASLPVPGQPCGPYFPQELLRDRGRAILDGPVGTFAWELRGMLDSPQDAFTAVEPDSNSDSEREQAEAQALSPESVALIETMRWEGDGDTAYALGEGLAEEVRHYTAGAIAFRQGCPRRAKAHFAAALALPDSLRTHLPHTVWAQFMLGRVAGDQGDSITAAFQYEKTRELVRRGLPDPLGLAVASLGEEARLSLRSGAINQAISLYLEQAAHGSAQAYSSLLFLTRKLLGNRALLDEGLADARTRRLVMLYVYTHGYSESYGEILLPPDFRGPTVSGESFDAQEDASSPDDPRPSVADKLVAALERHEPGPVAGAGWLAAAAYNAGRFDLAERLVVKGREVVAIWVNAKLAFRRGETDQALALLAVASKAFPTIDPSGNPQDRMAESNKAIAQRCRIQAEQGVLHLARQEYTAALDLFYEAVTDLWVVANTWNNPRAVPSAGEPRTDFWLDVAYIAERVLTTDELKAFVDRRVPAPTPEAVDNAFEQGDELPASALRALLARRLLREERADEARPYFDDEYVREAFEEYTAALDSAESRWRGDIGRAEAWYNAAQIARFDGMEILGFELAPDFATWGGSYRCRHYSWETVEPYRWEREAEADHIDSCQALGFAETQNTDAALHAQLEASLISADERERSDRSRADPDVRYSYRIVAVDHATRAADLLPKSSQAFAAVLCDATSWMLNDEPERVRPLYRRYVQEGPAVHWAKNFGKGCPQPDFAAARWRWWGERLDPLRGSLRPYKSVILGGISVIGLAAIGGWFLATRRRRASAH